MQTRLAIVSDGPPSFSLHGIRQPRLTIRGRRAEGPGAGLPALAVLYGDRALDLFLATEQAFSRHLEEQGPNTPFRPRLDLAGRWRRRDGGQGAWEFAAEGGSLRSSALPGALQDLI